ncbi:MAG TPA: M28 family peptidase [Pyrinomonadaceae bacterium]|nr:M28 family peptidase [Pyrinomonadaceae bacterium]
MNKGRSASRTTLTLMLCMFLPLSFIACPGGSQQQRNGSDQPAAPASPTPQQQPGTQASPPSGGGVSFDGARAFEHVRKQVEIGPRPAGSAELARAREYIVSELKSYGLGVEQDEFHPQTPEGVKKMVNITAELPGESSEIVMISSHYDTKPFKEFRFVGANDGGSSTGALLELARTLAAKGRPRFTYWFAFFDGEEAFCREWTECTNSGSPDNTYGSRHYVQQLQEKKELGRVRAMILLDMIGYKNLTIPRDDTGTTWINDIIWQTARELGHGATFIERIDTVEDDHVPFMRAGVECVDLIQLGGYPHWHTAEDTLDKISAGSLKTVGEVVLGSLPRIEQRLATRRSSP